MTKKSLILARNKLESINDDYLQVVIDNNYTYSSRDSFFVWDDNNEILTVIHPNGNTQMTPTPGSRVLISVFDYDWILMINTVPGVANNSWVDKVTSDKDQAEAIKAANSKLIDDSYFTK